MMVGSHTKNFNCFAFGTPWSTGQTGCFWLTFKDTTIDLSRIPL